MRRAAAALVLSIVAAACGGGSTGVESGDTASRQSATFDVPAGTLPELVTQTAEVIRRRLAALSIDDVSVTVHGEQITVELPSGRRGDHALVVAARPGDLEFRPVLGVSDPGAALVGPPDREAFIPNTDGSQVFDVGPAAVLGDAVEQARATKSAGADWTISLVLSQSGIDAFNSMAEACFAKRASCPAQRIAVVVESLVQSAPALQAGHFERDAIQIAGSFDEDEAEDLAAVLEAGALPVTLERVDA